MRTLLALALATMIGGVAAQENQLPTALLGTPSALAELTLDAPAAATVQAEAAQAAVAGVASVAAAEAVPVQDPRLLAVAQAQPASAEAPLAGDAPQAIPLAGDEARPESEAPLKGDEPQANPLAGDEAQPASEVPLQGAEPIPVGPLVVIDPLCAFDGTGCQAASQEPPSAEESRQAAQPSQA